MFFVECKNKLLSTKKTRQMPLKTKVLGFHLRCAWDELRNHPLNVFNCSQPLTPEGPTGTLAAIAQAITQQTVNPIPVTPAEPIPQFTTTPTPLPTMAAVATDIGESGALFGAPPPHFSGDRSKATNFLLAFKGWKAANNAKKAMVNPYTQVAVALTFIEGEDVQDWKEHKHELLEE